MAADLIIASDRTADRILFALKTRGPLSTGAVAQLMRMSVPGARQHLQRLLQADLVASSRHTEGVGRPALHWRLTEAAAARFPDTHSELSTQMIEAIRTSLGESALNQVVATCQRQMERRYSAAIDGARRIGTKLERLATARSADGYMAHVETTDSGWLFVENHCPICAAATQCQGFCAGELAMFSRLLSGACVERTEHIVSGARRCAYRITRAA
jgi:predicted ArsR family transcriptional regulator